MNSHEHRITQLLSERMVALVHIKSKLGLFYNRQGIEVDPARSIISDIQALEKSPLAESKEIAGEIRRQLAELEHLLDHTITAPLEREAIDAEIEMVV